VASSRSRPRPEGTTERRGSSTVPPGRSASFYRRPNAEALGVPNRPGVPPRLFSWCLPGTKARLPIYES
jgi:hypothetical protein